MSRDNPSEIPPVAAPFVEAGTRAADDLQKRGVPLHLAVVTCSYDTAFASVADQVATKVEELASVFPRGGPIRVSLWVVDDTDQKGHFSREAQAGIDRSTGHLAEATVQPLFYRSPGRRGQKGLALREGVLSALDAGADVVCTLNLNLKVHASQVATALRRLLDDELDVVVGTRAKAQGGVAAGAGRFGALKSQVWSGLVRATLPDLGPFLDQNAPLKMMRREAAGHLLRTARIDGVTLDSEWLLAFLQGGFAVGQVPICWVQRRGSRIPLWAIGPMVRDLGRLRRAHRRGRFGHKS